MLIPLLLFWFFVRFLPPIIWNNNPLGVFQNTDDLHSVLALKASELLLSHTAHATASM